MAQRKQKNSKKMAKQQKTSTTDTNYNIQGVGPTPDQVKAALKAREERVQPSYGSKAVDGWALWLASTNQPFAVLLSRFIDCFTPIDGGREFTPDDLDIEELRTLAPQAVEYFQELQASLLSELDVLVATVQGVPLLSVEIILTQFKAWGSYYEPDTPPNTLDHEILAAAVARKEPHSGRYPNPTDLLTALHLVAEIRNVAHTLSEAHQMTSDTQSQDDMLRGTTIQRWLSVRGASVPQFSQAVAAELASAYGRRFPDKLGFRYGDLGKMTDYIHKRWRGGVRDANSACWDFANQQTGAHPDSPQEATSEWRYHYYQSLLWIIPPILSVPITDLDNLLSDASGKHPARATAIMQHLGCNVGEWDKPPGPLADSPIRTHPFLVWRDKETGFAEPTTWALLANAGALDVDAALTIESLLGRSFPKDWSQKRAQVVDDYATQLLSKNLPGSTKASGIFVRKIEDGSEFEMDGLIVSGDNAIIIEGKGAPLKLASVRGDVKRLKSQFSGLIGEAWNQLLRDREALIGSLSREFRISRVSEGDAPSKLSLLLPKVRKVHFVIPTLDGLGEAGNNLNMLYQLGILPPNATPWIVSVADLALVTETLRSAPEFIAYLRFREKWASHEQVYVHDEIEMLAMFLEGTDLAYRVKSLTGRENAVAYISGGQARFDDYYGYLGGHGPIAKQPRKKTTTQVRRIVDELSRITPHGWLDAAATFLETPMPSAVAVEENWTSFNQRLNNTSWHLAGDVYSSVFVAREGVDWQELLSTKEVMNELSRRNFVWFARRDQRGKLHLEWASIGSEAKPFPRWRF
ncbi:hypothetical protein ABZV92_00495 [Streptomyces rubiginosohelvolus]|uniref:hypothetical protein n=1 Tax=Streptomyces rubiginosohelvolus TaxID=67362 RepID=UPI0033B1AA82